MIDKTAIEQLNNSMSPLVRQSQSIAATFESVASVLRASSFGPALRSYSAVADIGKLQTTSILSSVADATRLLYANESQLAVQARNMLQSFESPVVSIFKTPAFVAWQDSQSISARLGAVNALAQMDTNFDLARRQTDLSGVVARSVAAPLQRTILKQSGVALAALDSYSQTILAPPTQGQMTSLLGASSSVAGTIGYEALSLSRRPERANKPLHSLLELPAFREAGRFQLDLANALDRLVPGVSSHLHGAYEALNSKYAATSKAANCLVELVDQTFRAVAPADELAVWVDQQERQERYRNGNGFTLRARIHFAARNLPKNERQTAESQAEYIGYVLITLRGIAERSKHSRTEDVSRVRCLIQTVTGIMGQIFLLEVEDSSEAPSGR